MPLSNILKSATGTCPFCNQKASILSLEHPECCRTYNAGFQEMATLVAEAARTHALGLIYALSHSLLHQRLILHQFTGT